MGFNFNNIKITKNKKLTKKSHQILNLAKFNLKDKH